MWAEVERSERTDSASAGARDSLEIHVLEKLRKAAAVEEAPFIGDGRALEVVVASLLGRGAWDFFEDREAGLEVIGRLGRIAVCSTQHT